MKTCKPTDNARFKTVLFKRYSDLLCGRYDRFSSRNVLVTFIKKQELKNVFSKREKLDTSFILDQSKLCRVQL